MTTTRRTSVYWLTVTLGTVTPGELSDALRDAVETVDKVRPLSRVSAHTEGGAVKVAWRNMTDDADALPVAHEVAVTLRHYEHPVTAWRLTTGLGIHNREVGTA